MIMNYDVIRSWLCVWLWCCDVKRVMTSKIFKIKYFDGLNFVLVINNDDFDPDNSSKMTFVWPLFDHYESPYHNLWHFHILFFTRFNRKREIYMLINQVLRSDPQIGLFEPKQGLLHSSYFVELNQDVHAPLCST